MKVGSRRLWCAQSQASKCRPAMAVARPGRLVPGGGCAQPGDVGRAAGPGDHGQARVAVSSAARPVEGVTFLLRRVGPPGVMVGAVGVDHRGAGQPDVVVARGHVVFEVDRDVRPVDRPPGA